MQHESVHDEGIIHAASAVLSTRTASLSDSLGLYGLSDVRASKQSTTARILAPIGMSATSELIRIARAIPTFMVMPHYRNNWIGKGDGGQDICTDACVNFIFSKSAGVNGPGLFNMYSGTASFPISCKSAAASIARICESFVTPIALRGHGIDLYPPDVSMSDLILGVDCHC